MDDITEAFFQKVEDKLTPNEREFFRMKLDGYSREQIAESFGVSHQRASKILKKTHKKIIDILKSGELL